MYISNPQNSKYLANGPFTDERAQSGRTLFDGMNGVNSTTLTTRATVPLPFVISIKKHNSVVADPGFKLTLLVPPSNFSLSASHIQSSAFTRGGQLPTLWGTTQPNITLQGTTPAFMTDREGLTSTVGRGARGTDAFGYKHFMSLLAMFKANGYRRLNKQEDFSIPKARLMTGAGSRVPHVLDAVCIDYDGTSYYGHFTDLSFTDDSNSPYNYKYNLSFVVSGITGDYVAGHIGDGVNENSGILIGNNVPTVQPNMVLNANKLQIDRLDRVVADKIAEMGGLFGFGVTGPALHIDGDNATAVARMANMPVKYRAVFDKFLSDVSAAGYVYTINYTFRTEEEQRSIYGIAPGQPTPESKHMYWAAIDIQIGAAPGSATLLHNALKIGPNEVAKTEADREAIINQWKATAVPQIAYANNLLWGGDFQKKGRGDCVHFEINEPLSKIKTSNYSATPAGSDTDEE